MNVADDCVVLIHYTLTSDKGESIDSSRGGEPLAYLHGGGNIVPGLEAAMDGRSPGDVFQVRLEPEQGYGERQEDLVLKATRKQFPRGADIQVGMSFSVQGEQGVMPVRVVSVQGEDIVLDGNAELAGVALNFDVEVVDVRAATEEELSHGHVHGAGGHHH